MTYHRCFNMDCRRTVRDKDRRHRYVPRGVDGFAYVEDMGGCVHCSPSDEDAERAENGYWEQAISASREGA